MGDELNLRLLFDRKHPLVAACETNWLRTRQAYTGGRGYIDTALIQHMAEADLSFDERKDRAYYVTWSR